MSPGKPSRIRQVKETPVAGKEEMTLIFSSVHNAEPEPRKSKVQLDRSSEGIHLDVREHTCGAQS